jgi:toxin ParE1/3/4
MQIEVHPRAIVDARQSRRWYERRSPATANRFVEELDRAIKEIVAAPQRWPNYLHGTRIFRLRKFPFIVVYCESDVLIEIVAFAHTRRRPGYWKKRLP